MLFRLIFSIDWTSKSLLPEVLIGTFLFIIIIVIISSLDNSKKKKELDNWENSEEGKSLLKIPYLFDSLIGLISKETSACSKCSNDLFQFWELNNNTFIIRCASCKKKTSVSVEDNFTQLCNTYINYVNLAYSYQNEFIRQKMVQSIKYNFMGLRKGTPLIRAIEFIALGEEVNINDVRMDDKDSRRIPQKVKDKVWNRDGGRCVECGSNRFLEFDHIIPHSRGGANTYRNIQLLCESCNRIKSAKIG